MPFTDQDHKPLRVLLVDDHEIVCVGLAAVLSRFPDQVEVVGSAGELSEAIQAVLTLAPEIVLCDMRLRSTSGLDVCTEILRVAPAVKVVFMTVYDDEQYLYQALRAGASGYLTKRTDGPELVRHLENVHAGEIVIDPLLAGRVATAAAHLASGEFWPGARLGLTQRESEVLALLVAGLSNRGIATRLVVSDDTVKTHLRGLYRKLDVNDRAAAVAAALREGLFH
ncbi:MAG: response regulator transcription factor [Propionibacteriaceae bacterium]|nr:response regulator transcription factor [Propionibacteriaceae bacterium]